jgi:hypothetical protein
MKSVARGLRKSWHGTLRRALSVVPRNLRFAAYRRLVDCDPAPDRRLEVKIAETRVELEACFSLLHDAYVGGGFMKPHPSGMRVTPYHALPTTTTICALWDGQVVGTISMVREGVFGFPMQQAFDLGRVRAKGGNIAEVSALAVRADFRSTGGTILFPLLKFMYEYSTRFFDTRHLVIAVHPTRIELYESLLFFRRLQAKVVDKYDFANGAPAIGATLDLQRAPDWFRQAYADKPERKNLYAYFTKVKLPNLKFPSRRYFVTNDPVLTPPLLDYFFNQKVQVLAGLPERQRDLLHSIYDTEGFRDVLPPNVIAVPHHPMRRHRRYSIRLPARAKPSAAESVSVTVIEVSTNGCQAESALALTVGSTVTLHVTLGEDRRSSVEALVVRRHDVDGVKMYGFRIDEPDAEWRQCVERLERSVTHEDLLRAA